MFERRAKMHFSFFSQLVHEKGTPATRIAVQRLLLKSFSLFSQLIFNSNITVVSLTRV